MAHYDLLTMTYIWGGSTFYDTAKVYPIGPHIKKVSNSAVDEVKIEYFNLLRLLGITYNVREIYDQKGLFDNYMNSKLFISYNTMKNNLHRYFKFTLGMDLQHQSPRIEDLKERFPLVDEGILK